MPERDEPLRTSDVDGYNAVADHFDAFTERATQPLASTLVTLAGVAPDEAILDVGTGSGIVLLEAVRRLNGAGFFTGIDVSAGLLARARVKAGGRAHFEIADAERLPFADASFDRVLSLFALLHFPNPEKAVAEMMRTLKPGGRIVIGIGSRPPLTSVPLWLHGIGQIPNLVRQRTGRLLVAPSHLEGIVRELLAAPEAVEMSPAAHRRLDSPGAIALLREAGMQEIQTHFEARHLVLRDAAEFWDLQSTFSSFARSRLQAAGPEQVALVRSRFEADCARVEALGGSLQYHYGAFFISGRKAG